MTWTPPEPKTTTRKCIDRLQASVDHDQNETNNKILVIEARINYFVALAQGLDGRISDLEQTIRAVDLVGDGALKTILRAGDKYDHVYGLVRALERSMTELDNRARDADKTRAQDEDDRDADEDTDDPLPTISDRETFATYVAEVTTRLADKRITGQEARTLLYAAQLMLQANRDGSIRAAAS